MEVWFYAFIVLVNDWLDGALFAGINRQSHKAWIFLGEQEESDIRSVIIEECQKMDNFYDKDMLKMCSLDEDSWYLNKQCLEKHFNLKNNQQYDINNVTLSENPAILANQLINDKLVHKKMLNTCSQDV